MGLGIAGVAGRSWLSALAQDPGFTPQDADLVVFNATVYTVDPACPGPKPSPSSPAAFSRSAVTADMKALIGKKTQTYDASR